MSDIAAAAGPQRCSRPRSCATPPDRQPSKQHSTTPAATAWRCHRTASRSSPPPTTSAVSPRYRLVDFAREVVAGEFLGAGVQLTERRHGSFRRRRLLHRPEFPARQPGRRDERPDQRLPGLRRTPCRWSTTACASRTASPCRPTAAPSTSARTARTRSTATLIGRRQHRHPDGVRTVAGPDGATVDCAGNVYWVVRVRRPGARVQPGRRPARHDLLRPRDHERRLRRRPTGGPCSSPPGRPATPGSTAST